MNLSKITYNPSFKHIYVEKEIKEHPKVLEIVNKFPNSEIIYINKYLDVFGRTKQNFALQKQSQSLILAQKKGDFIYKGAPVCQDFGNEQFYYASFVMNCIFDCEYCFLRGMYTSANVVIFVNIEDFFNEVEKLLDKHEVYLCVSFDTDLVALENLTGFVKAWADFTLKNKSRGLKVEMRTKSWRCDIYDFVTPTDNLIFAYTMSPTCVVEKCEHRTASLEQRIKAISYALSKGFNIRLCFDPMLYFKNWKTSYEELIKEITAKIDMKDLYDVSLGSFRISKEYLKRMRRFYPYSPVIQFPYENVKGVYQYPEDICRNIQTYMYDLLKQHIDERKIYVQTPYG